MKLNRLNLGCGYEQPISWVNLDKLDYGQEIIADILEGLPFPDERFDFVLMNHTLQMFTYDELPIVLKEVRRVMKVGATLRILTPDIRRAIEACENHEADWFPISDKIEKTISGKCLRYIFWHGDTRCGFDLPALADLLERNGFHRVRWDAEFGECELDSREEESLIVTCQK